MKHQPRRTYNTGCRCEGCTEQHRRRVARSRLARLTEGRINHGTSGYDDGCRCDTCRVARKARHYEHYTRRAA